MHFFLVVELQVCDVLVYQVLFHFSLLLRLSKLLCQIIDLLLQLHNRVCLVLVMQLLRRKQSSRLPFKEAVFIL